MLSIVALGEVRNGFKRLPSLAFFSQVRQSRKYSSALISPLNIAFFGSDDFSSKSLEYVINLKKTHPQLISNIDVITRSAKRIGRGRKIFRDVPIAETAETYGLNIIRADNTEEINNLVKNSYNIAIAVSYGQLIPAGFLQSLKFGGLNVHPSLLPSYSGAAPLHRVLLNNECFTGVTIQGLHPTKFDRGRILKQSKEIPIQSDETLENLRDKLAVIGAEYLVQVCVEGNFRDPEFQLKKRYPFSKALKISTSTKQIKWEFFSNTKVERWNRALGPVFTFKEYKINKKDPVDLRVILDGAKPYLEGAVSNKNLSIGEYALDDQSNQLVIQTKEGKVSVDRLKTETFPYENAVEWMKKNQKRGSVCNSFVIKSPLRAKL
ncbi:Formyltransferase [Nadsonia fulvescens var. elongata DSM 6958]|uniref:methionyl-tRNA formyltransferase n=1 Tax=Nadsonia fulvescens var. elongata DSM 6958 TaxID=857566 RepID=A0A1E3PCN0_9ASCO|nr:Formyltransferase [Nadsonia fulvescens var. elongata DSM 6958]